MTVAGAPERYPGETDEMYYRRRLDSIADQRLGNIEARLGRLEQRTNQLFGALALLTVLVNLIVPIAARVIAP